MQYISLSALKKHFSGFQFPLTVTETDRFREAFYASEFARGASVYENEQRITHLSDPSAVLFMEWTDQEQNLLDVLAGKPVKYRFENKSKVKDHTFFEQYRKFITPFLYPVLDKGLSNTSLETWTAGLTYNSLLLENAADLIQETVYLQLKQEQEQLEREIARASSEEALVRALQPYLKPAFFDMLNLFTKSFYRARTNWMEVLLSVSSHRFSSRRLILHISKQISQLQLNPDHVKELRQLDKDIKAGAVEVEKKEIPWKRIAALVAIIGLSFTLIWFIWSVPVTSEVKEMENKTSYMSFTEAERKVMDSLLNQVTVQQQQPNNVLDEELLPYVGMDLVLKEPWKNETIRGMFDAWQSRDSTSTQPKSSESTPEKRVFPGTNQLKAKSGKISAAFSNDSDQSVIILVFRNQPGQPVYSQYVEKKAVITMKLNPEEYVFVLPGTKVPQNLSANQLPFEQVDSRFFTHMNNSYVVDTFSPQNVKLVWKEVNGVDFYLLDVSGALNRP